MILLFQPNLKFYSNSYKQTVIRYLQILLSLEQENTLTLSWFSFLSDLFYFQTLALLFPTSTFDIYTSHQLHDFQ